MDAEDWKAYKEEKKRQKEEYFKNQTPLDIQSLKENPNVNIISIDDDGSGGEAYKLEIKTYYGLREATWWASTGRWRAKFGKAEGLGIRNLLRYYKIEMGEK